MHRYYGTRNLHFITCSCYRRQPHLGTARRRDLFLTLLKETRRKYRFVVHGYVLMPEHFHLLITEPEVGDPSVLMKVIKQTLRPPGEAEMQAQFIGTEMALGYHPGFGLAETVL
ncbi:MAG: transposase [Acidobacteriia bacterium]|nr:transposase [Terriglobia bacterium]